MPFRLGTSILQLWPARNSTLSLLTSTQYNRSRGTTAPFETAMAADPLVPLKSNSLYPMKCAPFQSPSTRKPIRAFWMLKRASERFPLTVLLRNAAEVGTHAGPRVLIAPERCQVHEPDRNNANAAKPQI